MVYTEIEWNGHRRKSLTSSTELEHAYQRAVNPNKSQYGFAITSKNPFDDKQLEKKLKNIEKQQRLLSADMFWKQRQFFIDKAFDEDDQLRYAKLKNDVSKQKLSLPEIPIRTPFTETPTSSSRSSKSSNQVGKLRITSAFFPKIVEEDKRKVDYNKMKLLKKQKSLLQLQKRSDLIPSPIPTNSPDLRPGSNESVFRANPVLIPMAKNEATKRYQGLDQRKPKRKNKKQLDKTTRRNLDANNEYNKDPTESTFNHIAMPIREHLKSTSLENVPNSDLISLIRDANTDVVDPEQFRIDLNKIFENDKSSAAKNKFLSKSKESLTTDELLLKLTMSLPMRLLLKTDHTLTSLSSALGFEERRSRLIQREKTFADKTVLQDDRFQKLMNSLEKQDVNVTV